MRRYSPWRTSLAGLLVCGTLPVFSHASSFSDAYREEKLQPLAPPSYEAASPLPGYIPPSSTSESGGWVFPWREPSSASTYDESSGWTGKHVTPTQEESPASPVESPAPPVESPAYEGYRVITVPYASQCYPYGAWVGCEPTCLYMALQYRGAAAGVTLKDFLDALPRDSCNPARGFVGSPYQTSKVLRTTIYPAKLAEYGRWFYADVYDFTGASPAMIQSEVLAGNPVLVYATLYWKSPVYKSYLIDGQEQRLISNNHAVLVTGYNASTGEYHITDPYNLGAADKYAPYTYWVNGTVFETSYNLRQHAIVIR